MKKVITNSDDVIVLFRALLMNQYRRGHVQDTISEIGVSDTSTKYIVAELHVEKHCG